MKRPVLINLAVVLTFLTAGNSLSAAEALGNAIQSRLEAQQDARASQKRIDVLANETRSLLEKYRYAIRRTDSLKAYNAQIRKRVKDQKRQMLSIQRQLESIDETKRSIMPLLSRMVSVLDKFVSLDIPFLVTERKARVKAIKKMMGQADVTVPEKYRRIMEAYQIELEYGRTIESYNDEIKINGSKHTVDMLRVGRIALVYQTLDGGKSGFWDTSTKSWRPLPEEYGHSIAQGIKIAQKQSPPEFFNMPIHAPGAAK
ncbi:MAG: DUF3450 domain-containing protein [Gammaproteobacteria bacterium]